jgi:hypothetical protein
VKLIVALKNITDPTNIFNATVPTKNLVNSNGDLLNINALNYLGNNLTLNIPISKDNNNYSGEYSLQIAFTYTTWDERFLVSNTYNFTIYEPTTTQAPTTTTTTTKAPTANLTIIERSSNLIFDTNNIAYLQIKFNYEATSLINIRLIIAINNPSGGAAQITTRNLFDSNGGELNIDNLQPSGQNILLKIPISKNETNTLGNYTYRLALTKLNDTWNNRFYTSNTFNFIIYQPTTTTTTRAPTTTTTTRAPTTTTTTRAPTTTTTTRAPTTTTTTRAPTTTTTTRAPTTTTTTRAPTTTTTTRAPTTTTTTRAPTTTTTTTTRAPTTTTTTLRPTTTTTTRMPTTTTTTTLSPSEKNIGLEMRLDGANILKSEQELRELFKNYSNNSPEIINIINKSNFTINTNAINFRLNDINVTKQLKDSWIQYVETIKYNKNMFIIDLLGIDSITNERVLYISPIFNSNYKIYCNFYGCSDENIKTKENCTYPNYWCNYENETLIRKCE